MQNKVKKIFVPFLLADARSLPDVRRIYIWDNKGEFGRMRFPQEFLKAVDSVTSRAVVFKSSISVRTSLETDEKGSIMSKRNRMQNKNTWLCTCLTKLFVSWSTGKACRKTLVCMKPQSLTFNKSFILHMCGLNCV